jgi:hypothetical protein
MLSEQEDAERLAHAAQRRPRIAALLAGVPARTAAEVERDECEAAERGLFDALIAAERGEDDARRALTDLHAREAAIISGHGDVEGRARQLSAVRDELSLAELRLADATRAREMADRRCEHARVRQQARRIEQAQREHAKWERWRDGQLDEMRRLQHEADVIHARFLSVDGLHELAQRRAVIEKLASGRR